MNPPDENAVEESLRIKESGKADEIVVVSIGEEKSKETIRTALAMGADRGILVNASDGVEPLAISKIVSKIVESENISYIGNKCIKQEYQRLFLKVNPVFPALKN